MPASGEKPNRSMIFCTARFVVAVRTHASRVTAVLTRKMPASVTRATPAHRRTDSIPHSNGFAERAETCGPVGGPGGAEENGGGAPVGTAPGGGGGGARWGATEALVRSAASKMATRSVRSCTWRSMSMMPTMTHVGPRRRGTSPLFASGARSGLARSVRT